MAKQSLKDKTVNGVSWSFIDSAASQGIHFIVSIVLARLLSPSEYGLIGIIAIFITVFNGIVDSGFNRALIRKHDAKDIDFCTAFFTNLAFSIVLAFILFLSAPLIAVFFKQPELTDLTRVMSSIVIINAFAIVQKTRLTKAINFKTQTKISIISSLLSGGVGIFMAFSGFGVWALVGQQITEKSANCVLLWVFNKWIPRLQFSWVSFKELWGFGWKLLVSGLIDNLWKEIYQVVVGKFYSPQTLGLYTRAKQFTNIFSTNLTVVVQRVSYPVLSSIKEDKVRLKNAYRRVIRTTMLVTFSCMLMLASVAHSLVFVLIGEKWMECVPFLQIICFSAMLYPLHAINLNMLQVQGRSDLFLKLEIIKKCIAIGPLLLGIFFSIYLMVAGSVISSFIAFFLNSYYSGPFLNYSTKDQVKDILPSFGIALFAALVSFGIRWIPHVFHFTNEGSWIYHLAVLLIQLVVGLSVIIGISSKKKLPEYVEIKDIITSLFKKIIHIK